MKILPIVVMSGRFLQSIGVATAAEVAATPAVASISASSTENSSLKKRPVSARPDISAASC